MLTLKKLLSFPRYSQPPNKEKERQKEREPKPSSITLSSLAGLALLLILLILKEPSALALLNNTSPHHLSPEPVQELLLRLIVFHNNLNIVGRFEEKGVGVCKRWAHNGHQIGGRRVLKQPISGCPSVELGGGRCWNGKGGKRISVGRRRDEIGRRGFGEGWFRGKEEGEEVGDWRRWWGSHGRGLWSFGFELYPLFMRGRVRSQTSQTRWT